MVGVRCGLFSGVLALEKRPGGNSPSSAMYGKDIVGRGNYWGKGGRDLPAGQAKDPAWPQWGKPGEGWQERRAERALWGWVPAGSQFGF